MTFIDVPPALPDDDGLGIGPMALDVYPKVHGIVGAQFGDLEFDVGKSVRWLEFYVNDLFIVDINTGDQRYWVVNWTESFPNAEYTVSGRNFFYDTTQAAEWRREQFEWADKQWSYTDDDWVIFVDAHEGLSFDNRSLPDDYDAAPFMSWIYREIERVGAGDTVILPFFAYLRYSDLQNVTYGTEQTLDAVTNGVPAVSQAVSVPWYLPMQGLPRLFKVSALRDPDFDWESLDQPVAPTADCKLQIVSYGYAHWQMLDIPPGQTEVPPLSAATDLGWEMRQLLSRIRPAPGVPFDDPWKDPSTDPTSYPGPWCVDTMLSIAPDLPTTVEEDGHTPPAAQCEGIRVPLYDTVMRLNLRDGLWYEQGNSGNMPLTWDDVNGVWVPRYDPNQWPASGVASSQEDEPPLSRMSLSLPGSPTVYTRIGDANYLDFQHAFTFAAVLAADDWTPAARQFFVHKGASWYWAIETDFVIFGYSRDGTVTIEKQFARVDLPEFDLADGEVAAIGISFNTDISQAQDEIRVWCWMDDMWMQCGETMTEPNEDYLPIINTTDEVRVGESFAGLIRMFSLRYNVGTGDDTSFGGTEVARLRGDITSNPSYDRYGNLWSNQGTGWTYEELPEDPPPVTL